MDSSCRISCYWLFAYLHQSHLERVGLEKMKFEKLAKRIGHVSRSFFRFPFSTIIFCGSLTIVISNRHLCFKLFVSSFTSHNPINGKKQQDSSLWSFRLIIVNLQFKPNDDTVEMIGRVVINGFDFNRNSRHDDMLHASSFSFASENFHFMDSLVALVQSSEK